jgi:hypothetical protein
MRKFKFVGFRVEPQQQERLRKLATTKKLSASALIRKLIDQATGRIDLMDDDELDVPTMKSSYKEESAYGRKPGCPRCKNLGYGCSIHARVVVR